MIEKLTPIEKLFIAEYYKDYEQNRKDVKSFEEYVGTVFELSVKYVTTKDESFKEQAINLLESWCKVNKGYSGNEANLYLVYKGHLLIHSAILLDYKSINISTWICDFYLPAAKNISSRINNYGSWGLYGEYIANEYLEKSNKLVIDRAKKHLWLTTLSIPFISKKNEVWTENLRSTSGIEYTYFFIAPVLMMALRSKDFKLTNKVKDVIKKFFIWCNHPETWPYKAWPGFLRKIQKVLFPCVDDLIIPMQDNWAGSLIYIAGMEFNIPEYLEWMKNVKPTNYVNVFRFYLDLKSVNML